MQIQPPLHTTQQSERAMQLREGDVYRVTVKEQKGNHEALLSVRGREMVAKFEGAMPKGERTTVQVLGSEADRIHVKVIHDEGVRGTQDSRNQEPGRQQGVNQTLRQLGIQQPTPELRQAATTILDKGGALSKEAVRDLQKFLNEGDSKRRLQSVQALANKRLEATSTHLRSIHEALHGRPVHNVLTDLAKEIDRDFKVEPVARERIERQNQTLNSSIREVRQDVQTARTVEQVSEQIERRLIQNNRVSRDQADQLERVVQQARSDVTRGREGAGLERIVRTLNQMERDVRGPQERGQVTEIPAGNRSQVADQIAQTRNEIQRESVQKATDRVLQLANLVQKDPEFSKAIERVLAEVRKADRVMTDRISQALLQVERITKNPAERQALRDIRMSLEQQGLTQATRERVETIRGEARTPVHEQLIREIRQANQVQQVSNDRLVRAINSIESQVQRVHVEQPTQTGAPIDREGRQDVQGARTVQQASGQIEGRLTQNERVSRDQVGQLERVAQQVRSDAAGGTQNRGQAQSNEGNGSRIVDQIAQVRNEIPRESIQRAADRVQQLTHDPQIDRETSRTVNRALTESRQLDRISHDRMNAALQQTEHSIKNEERRQALLEVRQQLAQGGLSHSVNEKVEMIIRQIANSDVQISQQLSKTLLQANQLQNVAHDRLQQSLNAMEQSIPSKQRSDAILQVSNLGEVAKEAETALQREASLERAIKKVHSLLSGHQALTKEEQNKFRQSINEANELQQQGRELKSRQEVANAIEDIKQINQIRQQEITTYTQNEGLQTSVDLSSKSIAVTTVTEKMAEMASDFKKLQRDITRNLDLINRQIEQFRSQAHPQAKPLLETTIKNLDNAILKSEMMLLTDMKTERQLMQASSQLAEAKKLLTQGKHHEANEIVRDVKQQVERLQFQPSETKVKLYTAANEQVLREWQSPNQSFGSKYAETVRGPIQEGSPRAMFEMIRNAGLNRDSEIAMQLASGREQHEASDRNLKSILMQLARGEEEGTRVQQLASQALSNITGQQLLSRSDQQNNLQSLYFQLPMLLEDKVENLQVFVNSRNEGEQVDWENCSLYFLMETPKMGEIGIAVSAAKGHLSVTLKNDKGDFEQKMTPLVEMAVAKLSEIGYSINGINFSKLSKGEELIKKEERETSQQPVFGEKGFDYKI
ncbi:hypothetical protein [Halalkalibacter okhensis]|uniref:hypothetical protein n=1 Tax=Halalkalibacter okhensis TaxID=333138 RepID=UPI0006902951|nr:hypothetical protein [Halalkalibacter okhensis]